MNKILLTLVIFLYLLSSCSCTRKPDFVKKYPNGLISGTDYGILNENDLAVDTLYVNCLTKFLETDNRCPYQRWQCFKTSTLKMVCDDTGFDEDYKEEMGALIITNHF